MSKVSNQLSLNIGSEFFDFTDDYGCEKTDGY